MQGSSDANSLIRSGKAAVASFKSASSSIRFQKSASDLWAILDQLCKADSSTDEKAKASTFIEAFGAAHDSLQGASHDGDRLAAGLKTARTALKGLRQSRSVLKGRIFEIEIQQYSLVRRLIALRAYREVTYES